MQITEQQFEEIKALVIQETGASVYFYDKRKFSGKLEGYALLDSNPPHICVCRSNDKLCFNRATLVMLHEYGHIIDLMKNKKTKRVQNTFKLDPTFRGKEWKFKLSRQEKIWLIKDEWYADFYAMKFVKKNDLLYLYEKFLIEQTVDVRCIYTEIVLGKDVSREITRAWRRELKANMQIVKLSDIDRLQYV